MSEPRQEPQIPRLPRFSRQSGTAQRVSLSGFLLAHTMEQADRISMLVADYLATCRAAPGCMRAEIWRSRSEPMRFAVFLRFRSQDDYRAHIRACQGGSWWQETSSLSEALRLHPE